MRIRVRVRVRARVRARARARDPRLRQEVHRLGAVAREGFVIELLHMLPLLGGRRVAVQEGTAHLAREHVLHLVRGWG